MNERRLIEALNGSIDRLAAGQTVEDCIRAYPDVGDELRPLLEMGQAASRARAGNAEVRNVRSRLDSRINTLIEEIDFQPSGFHLPQGGAVLLVAILLLILVGVLLFLQRAELQYAAHTALTPSTESPSMPPPSLTAAAPETPESPRETLTPTAAPTDTPSPTRTRTATPTFTLTESPSPTTGDAVCVVEPPENWETYHVQSGDTLSAIAALSGSTVDELQRVNCIDNVSSIVTGQLLYVPRLRQSEVDSSTDSPDDNTHLDGDQPTDDGAVGNTDNGANSNTDDGAVDDNDNGSNGDGANGD